MWIALPRHGRQLLGYEMNVHRLESLRDFRQALRRFVAPVRDRLAPAQAFGIAPRVGRKLLRELGTRRARERLRDELAAGGWIPYTVNAFPLGDFQARRVKEQVYAPPWTARARGDLTIAVAELLATLLPDGIAGSISTLAGTYRLWGNTRRELSLIAANYLRVIKQLILIEQKRGKRIVLAVEPEPDTTLEDAADCIALFEDHMLPLADAAIARPLKLSRARARALVRRHFTVNLDVCHQSVLFRDPVEQWKMLEARGLGVGKLHITSALALTKPARSPARLRELLDYDEPRYLHQFAARTRSGLIWRGADLSHLGVVASNEIEEVRVHFHVPVSRRRIGALATTQADTARAIQFALSRKALPHLAIETYTWPLLTARKLTDAELVDGIVGEFRWTLRTLGKG